MTTKHTGGPAFPWYDLQGMTLRDYFAAMALQGMVSNPGCGSPKMVASYSYELADAMLAERAKE